MGKPLHTIVETAVFSRAAASAGMTEGDVEALKESLAETPEQGDLVQGSGGIRKVRVAGRGKGKSGGYRVLTAYLGSDYPLILLGALNKGDRANFAKSEITTLRDMIEQFKSQIGKARRTK